MRTGMPGHGVVNGSGSTFRCPLQWLLVGLIKAPQRIVDADAHSRALFGQPAKKNHLGNSRLYPSYC